MLCTDEYPQAAPNQQKALTGEMGGAAATSRRRRDAARHGADADAGGGAAPKDGGRAWTPKPDPEVRKPGAPQYITRTRTRTRTHTQYMHIIYNMYTGAVEAVEHTGSSTPTPGFTD